MRGQISLSCTSSLLASARRRVRPHQTQTVPCLGAAASSAPDLEHIVPWLRPGGKKLFHCGGGSHFGGVPASLQLLLAGAIVGFLLGTRRSSSRDARGAGRPTPQTASFPGRH